MTQFKFKMFNFKTYLVLGLTAQINPEIILTTCAEWLLESLLDL